MLFSDARKCMSAERNVQEIASGFDNIFPGNYPDSHSHPVESYQLKAIAYAFQLICLSKLKIYRLEYAFATCANRSLFHTNSFLFSRLSN